jgi:hypothetical protein
MLGEINEEFSRRDLRLGLANLHAQPRALLSRSGLLASIGFGMLFARVEDAALAFERTSVSVQKPGTPLV